MFREYILGLKVLHETKYIQMNSTFGKEFGRGVWWDRARGQ